MADDFLQQYLKPLRGPLDDQGIVEIALNPDGAVFVERHGLEHMECLSDLKFTERQLSDLGRMIASTIGLELGNKNPIVSGKIQDNKNPIRAQVLVSPAVETGASITLRKYSATRIDVDSMHLLFDKLVDLDEIRQSFATEIKNLAANGDVGAALKLAMERRMNVLISGGTSSGKTTFAKALLDLVHNDERILTIEDAFELFPCQPNSVCLLADREPESPRSTDKLLQSTLRMRPDRIVVGELRGDEAKTFLEAINTGHGGSFTTIHAETARKALDRLALLMMGTGVNMNYREVLKYCATSIDLVVQLARVGGKRGLAEIFLPSTEVEF